MIGTIRNLAGERLAYSWVGPDADRVVLIGHGLTSDKDRPWSEALSASLREQGLPSLRFAFAGNGESEGRFEDAHITKEIRDLGAVIDAVAPRRVAYVGHSMGGAVGALRAAGDARIEVLVSLAAIAHTSAFVERLFGGLRPGVDVMLEKPHCPLTEGFLEDMRQIESLLPVAPKIAVPWLLLHGAEDVIVPDSDSRDMYAHANPSRSRLAVFEGMDHAFTGPGCAQMTATVVEFLQENWES